MENEIKLLIEKLQKQIETDKLFNGDEMSCSFGGSTGVLICRFDALEIIEYLSQMLSVQEQSKPTTNA